MGNIQHYARRHVDERKLPPSIPSPTLPTLVHRIQLQHLPQEAILQHGTHQGLVQLHRTRRVG